MIGSILLLFILVVFASSNAAFASEFDKKMREQHPLPDELLHSEIIDGFRIKPFNLVGRRFAGLYEPMKRCRDGTGRGGQGRASGHGFYELELRTVVPTAKRGRHYLEGVLRYLGQWGYYDYDIRGFTEVNRTGFAGG